MKPVRIDFAPAKGWWDVGSDRRSRRLWWSGSLILLLACLFALLQLWRVSAEAERADSARARAQAELERAGNVDENANLAQIESAEAVAHATRHLAYPWAGLVGGLEQVARSEVSLMSLEFGIVRSSNKLVIETAEVGQGMEYLEALRKQPVYRNMVLVRQEAVVSDGNPKWRMTFEAAQNAEPVRRATAGAAP